MELPDLDFCALAAGHDVQSIRVDRREDLDAALMRVLSAPTPMLLEARVVR